MSCVWAVNKTRGLIQLVKRVEGAVAGNKAHDQLISMQLRKREMTIWSPYLYGASFYIVCKDFYSLETFPFLVPPG